MQAYCFFAVEIKYEGNNRFTKHHPFGLLPPGPALFKTFCKNCIFGTVFDRHVTFEATFQIL